LLKNLIGDDKMKKLTNTIAIFMAVAATSVFAHHPSEGVNPNFEMVDEQVSDMHEEMLPDDMGAITTFADGNSEMLPALTRDSVGEINTARPGLAENVQDQSGEGPGMDAAAAAGTMELLQNVAR
jgi:hypothetical protein